MDEPSITQWQYVQKLEPLSVICTSETFASIRMKLAWLAQSRIRILYEILQFTQVTRKRFDVDQKWILKELRDSLEVVKNHDVWLAFHKFYISSMHVLSFSDVNFVTNADQTSQLGYIVFFSNRFGTVVPIGFKSHNSRRVTLSAFAAELIAFADMFYVAYTLSIEL